MNKNSGEVGMLSAVPADISEVAVTPLQQEFRGLASIDVTPNIDINTDTFEDSFINAYNIDACAMESITVNRPCNRMNPFAIAKERINTWPEIDVSVENLSTTYNKVKATGLPNLFGAKILLQ